MRKENLFYQEMGKGRSVILLHGLAASHHDWKWLAADLINQGFKAYYPDLPGHGASPGPIDPNCFNVNFIIDRLISWIEQVEISLPLTLIGHSLGGYLCLGLVKYFGSHVTKLVLVSPLYTPNQIFILSRMALKYPILGELSLRLVKVPLITTYLKVTEPLYGKYPPEARLQTALDFKQTDPASMRYPNSIKDLSTELAEIHCPTLVIWGKHDSVLMPKFQSFLTGEIPKARGFTFENCGHEPHFTKMERFNPLVLSFLKD